MAADDCPFTPRFDGLTTSAQVATAADAWKRRDEQASFDEKVRLWSMPQKGNRSTWDLTLMEEMKQRFEQCERKHAYECVLVNTLSAISDNQITLAQEMFPRNRLVLLKDRVPTGNNTLLVTKFPRGALDWLWYHRWGNYFHS